MEDQLDGFEFVKIEYGRRFYAYNTKGNFIIFWLGNDTNRELMEARIEQYGSPHSVVVKDFTRHEALRYYSRAKKANDTAIREELKHTEGRGEPQFGERFYPLSKWRLQPRF
jgi:hypothetical protein